MTEYDFERDGIAIHRGDLGDDLTFIHMQHARNWIQDRKPEWNPVAVDVPEWHELRWMIPIISHSAMRAMNRPIKVYNFRLVVKDKHAPDAVFLHQDCCYHIGSLPKLSAFVALSRVYAENGAMRFWLGTHKYGYLGDAGEIDPKIHPGEPRIVCPTLEPGDVVLMHSALWHDSGPNTAGVDRILADIIYARADDPALKLPREGIFKRSRVSRIRDLERALKECSIP